ncbi:MAG: hypothetical protein COS95_07745 [Ignavibacteriales bacterium CG07_land_8_20_14_0_80_59_12]|nr:MAG: hypothetical protein COS95_07745 [Ignavibacteriales bacterium CG07_land_8_20_14_0_80_59_12]
MPDTKQRARVVGVIITQCPACNNTVNFDRVTKKICPYCGAEIELDQQKIEVVVRPVEVAKVPNKSKKRRVKLYLN